MGSGVPLRGSIWEVVGQRETTVGLLVVSNDANNRVRGEVTGVPVLTKPPADRPTVDIETGHVVIGELRRFPASELTRALEFPSEAHLAPVWEGIADLLLLPELLSRTPRWPRTAGDGDYPRWGRIYYAEPPIGGQTKRWLVVSHDIHNRATGRVVCVRTTSNTDLESFEAPCIQRGLALAVCPDVVAKAQERFDLESASSLPQIQRDEMVVVARALTNFLLLHRATGVFG